MSPGPAAAPAQAALNALKLLALVAMLADHVGKAWAPLAAEPWHLAGRPALLLFALVIAHRVAEQPARAARYLPRLLAWGLVAQPAFLALGGEGLNVLFTHAAGCLVVAAMHAPSGGDRALRAHALVVTLVVTLVVALLLCAAAPAVEYGLAGTLLVPVGVLLLQQARAAALPGLALLCLAANAPAPWALLLPTAGVLALAALLAQAVLALQRLGPGRPLRGFLALYAGHLSLLAAWAHGPGLADFR